MFDFLLVFDFLSCKFVETHIRYVLFSTQDASDSQIFFSFRSRGGEGEGGRDGGELGVEGRLGQRKCILGGVGGMNDEDIPGPRKW